MTRINLIPASKLHNKHLLAEHREIKRIPNCVKKGRYSMDNMPDDYRLGTGHVKFFYNKIGYLKKRYEELYTECLKRGFNVTYYGDSFEGIPVELMGDYEPTQEAIKLNIDRINERILNFKNYKL